MSLRLYFAPIVGDGLSEQTAFRTKVPGTVSSVIPSRADGRPVFSFALTMARAADWTAYDADPTLDRLFGIDLPDSIETFADLKAYLQSKTVGDIPLARRTALNTRLTSRGFDTSQVTLATTWWRVLKGAYAQMGMSDNDGPQV